MPRNAGIDAPGALHHIIVRGIERKKIFKDDTDRINFPEVFNYKEKYQKVKLKNALLGFIKKCS